MLINPNINVGIISFKRYLMYFADSIKRTHFMVNTEIITNPDGSIYHLSLHPEDIAKIIITVGDPDRVAMVSKYFDKVTLKKQNREFVTHTGELQGKQLTVLSTGIGTDNIDIVLNELDILAKFDLQKLEITNPDYQLEVIRIGTSGTIHSDIPVDSFLASEFAIGLDGLLLYYLTNEHKIEKELYSHFMSFCELHLKLPMRPYIASADRQLMQEFGSKMAKGITVTCPGFYGPQGRQINAKIFQENYLNSLRAFSFHDRRITNFEMETAGIYGLARELGHKSLSCNAILANRATGEFSKEPQKTIDKLITEVLTVIINR